ncbi:MAG: hypothetical protein WBA25_08215 [Jannaschia sp.]
MHRTLVLPAVAIVALLSACVQQGDLASGAVGAGIGCLAGEVIEDGKCAEGAVLGGAAGVATNRIR